MQDSDISPAERRRIRVRESIIEAAERVFASEGEAGLSIRRIADEIDYSPAAIYKYFNSKDDLVDELKETFFGRLLARMNDIADQEAAFDIRARRCVSGYVRIAIEKPHHYAAAFSGLAGTQDAPHDEARSMENTNKGRAFAVLTDMVEEGVACGRFRPGLNLVDAAKSVWVSTHGLAMMICHLPDFPGSAMMPAGLDQEAFVEFHADLVVRSLEAGAGRPE